MEPESFTHCNLAALSTSYVPLTIDGATAVAHPESPRAGSDDVPTYVAEK